MHRPAGVLAQVHQVEQLGGPGPHVGPLQPVRGAEEVEVLGHGQLVVDAERVGHPAHLPPHPDGVGGRIRTGDEGLAAVGPQERGEDQQQRRLAGTVGADQSGHLPVRCGQAHSGQRRHRTEGSPHIGDDHSLLGQVWGAT